jgi:hypothetical protein
VQCKEECRGFEEGSGGSCGSNVLQYFYWHYRRAADQTQQGIVWLDSVLESWVCYEHVKYGDFNTGIMICCTAVYFFLGCIVELYFYVIAVEKMGEH